MFKLHLRSRGVKGKNIDKKQHSPKKTDSITTFIGTDASFEGTIDFTGTIRLDGKVKGIIKSSCGTVIVGEKAVIDADIIVDTAIVMGHVNGFIDAKERIEVYPPGSVVGNIQAPVISIDPGVKFTGNCAMKGRTIATITNSKSQEHKSENDLEKMKKIPKNL